MEDVARDSRHSRLLPALGWLSRYRRADLASDAVAGTIVAIMLVPQGMAYAMLAGLPAQIGLYASIVPLVLYALFGNSRTLAVGPVAIVSLLVANAIADFGAADPSIALSVALALAMLSGIFLIALGIARLGFLVNFISHPVISGFTSAAAIVIGISQLGALLGISVPRGTNAFQSLKFVAQNLDLASIATVAIGIATIALLVFWPRAIRRLFSQGEGGPIAVTALTRAGPLIAVVVGTAIVALLSLDTSNAVAVVGNIPQGLPDLTLPSLALDTWRQLVTPALLIVFVGFMESVAVAKTLASKRRQKIDANQELIALGVANLGAGATGGYPVTGGFSRSVVNFSAGAQTPLASIITAAWVALTVVLLTPWFYFLPRAVLSAVVLVAVLTLVDSQALLKSWRYNKADAFALIVTFLTVLYAGVEVGIIAGMALSIALYLFRTSRPHIAVVGRVGTSEHFRNIRRHPVQTIPEILLIRVDESLYFANTRFLEDYLLTAVADAKAVNHVVLIMSAVNFVDSSALESLETLIEELRSAGVTLHLAEVKGPVMDQFERSDFLDHLLPGQIFLSTHEAISQLNGGKGS